MHTNPNRAGRYIRQPAGFRSFVTESLPPSDPPIAIDNAMIELLTDANLWLGRLDGVSQILPNPDFFVSIYVRREAVLSSQIEGTQSTLQDVLTFELEKDSRGLSKDVVEVVNYVRAMNFGLERLHTLPLSLRLIREIHSELLTGVRGSERSPGMFRTSQNWIGGPGPDRAAFVPPAPHDMNTALDNFEKFLHARGSLPKLVHTGLVHAQFETIHPFLNGNGRVGRLLITLLLVENELLTRPLLYLSDFFKRRRSEYYDRLQAVRDSGDWEGWLRFFLEGIRTTAMEASQAAQSITRLREDHRGRIVAAGQERNGLALLDELFSSPIVTRSHLEKRMGVHYMTASRLVERFVEMGILREVSERHRNRLYEYESYLRIFDEHGKHSGN